MDEHLPIVMRHYKARTRQHKFQVNSSIFRLLQLEKELGICSRATCTPLDRFACLVRPTQDTKVGENKSGRYEKGMSVYFTVSSTHVCISCVNHKKMKATQLGVCGTWVVRYENSLICVTAPTSVRRASCNPRQEN